MKPITSCRHTLSGVRRDEQFSSPLGCRGDLESVRRTQRPPLQEFDGARQHLVGYVDDAGVFKVR